MKVIISELLQISSNDHLEKDKDPDLADRR